MIRSARTTGESVLLLDSGDTLFRREPIPDILKPQLSLKAEVIAKLHERMGYSAVAAGETDIALGGETFTRVRSELQGPAAYSQWSVNGRNIGLIMIESKEVEEQRGRGPVEPVELARAHATAHRGKVELLIVVSHLGLDADKALAAAVPEIDVIVGGHDGLSLQSPARAGNALIVQAHKQGKFLGRLRLHLHPGWRSAGLVDASESERWKELAEEYDQAVKRFTRELKDAAAPGERERAQGSIEHYTKEAQQARANVRDFSDRSWFANHLVPLDKRVADDPVGAEAVRLYKEEARKLNEALADSLAAAPKEGPAFIGDGSCVGCHGEEQVSWSRTPHAKAFETLVRRGQEFDLECIGCHTTAFQEKGGFFLPAKVGDWKGVQCESCHGPGEGHPPRKLVHTPPRDACVRCHQPPQHDGFDYDASLPKTRHGK